MKTTLLIGAIVAGFGLTTLEADAQGRGEMGPGMSFEALDADGDGLLTAEDFAAVAASRFAEADTDGNGGLSVEELTAHLQAEAALRMAERSTRMLAERDANEDGLLQPGEMMPQDGRGIERMLSRFDADEDGALSAEEFAAAQARMAERGGRGHGGRDHGGRDGHGHGDGHGDGGRDRG